MACIRLSLRKAEEEARMTQIVKDAGRVLFSENKKTWVDHACNKEVSFDLDCT